MITYYARFAPDRKAGGFVLTFPDFRYGVTQGETIAEATDMAQDLLMGLISDLIEEGKDLPKSGKKRSRTFRPISLPALQSAKVELYQAFRAAGLRKSDFAARMGIPKSNLDRLFNLKHHSRFDQIESAFPALTNHIWVEVPDPALHPRPEGSQRPPRHM